jgi:hypothetical protein
MGERQGRARSSQVRLLSHWSSAIDPPAKRGYWRNTGKTGEPMDAGGSDQADWVAEGRSLSKPPQAVNFRVQHHDVVG